MKLASRVFLLSAAILLLVAVSAFAQGGTTPNRNYDLLPVNSGWVLSFVPMVQIYDFQSTMTWEDKTKWKGSDLGEGLANNADAVKASDEIDSDLNPELTGGLSLQLSYIMDGGFFVTGELSHQIYLYKANAADFDDLEYSPTDSPDDNVHFRIKNFRGGALLGYYFRPAPFRPYIQVGADLNTEKLTAFDRKDYHALNYNAVGVVGADFFVSRHLVVGASFRADYYIGGETWETTYEKDYKEHDISVTMNRIPAFFNAKIGYMF